MDVTTFDARITREATESRRNSVGASVNNAEESAFADHLLPRDASSRQPDSADSSPLRSYSDETADADAAASPDAADAASDEQPLEGVTTSEQSAPDGTTEDDTPSEAEQEEIAALAAASTTQEVQTPRSSEPTGATPTQELAEPATEASDAPQPAAKATDAAAAMPKEIAATSATGPLAESASGVPHDAAEASPQTNASPADQSSAQSSATAATAAMSPPGGLETLAAQDTTQIAATAESAEKPSASTKTRTGKSGTKPNATGTKGKSGEATADESTSPKETPISDNTVSLINPATELPPADTTGDRSPKNPANVTVGSEIEAVHDTQTRTQSLTERLPEQIFGKSSAATGGNDELSSADQMRLIQRVARAIEAAPQNGGVLRLRLRPPELGAVRLEVALQRGKMTARIETETTQARNVLLDQLPQLRERLEGQGIRIERFDVEVGSQNQGDSPSHSSHTEESYSIASRDNRPKTVETEPTRTAASETRRVISATRVNVII